MLKSGFVYKHIKGSYFYVKSHRRVKRRLLYTVSKIQSNGHMGSTYEVYFKRGDWTLVKDAEVEIQVWLPKADKHRIKWQNTVDKAKDILMEMVYSTDVALNKERSKEIAILAISSIYYQNNIAGRRFNLRDFAKGIGLKRYQKLYKFVELYLKTLYTKDKYKKALPEAASSTLQSNYNKLKVYWDGLHGFNKEINSLLEFNLQQYAKEMAKRGVA